MKTFPVLCALAALVAIPSARAATFTYSNPLPFEYKEGQTEPKKEVRDPCIIREGDTYYLVFTMHPFANREDNRMSLPDNGSSPGIAMYASKDLKDWKFVNWIVRSADLPENSPYKHRFWAPEIHKIKNKFYLIFTADNWLKPENNPAGNWGSAGYAFIGVADKVTGPYRHITYLEGGACDTSLFADTDGKTYAIMPRGVIDIQPIDLSGIEQGRVKLTGQATTLVKPDQSDVGADVKAEYFEGPWMEKINGLYTLFYAELFRDTAPPEWRGYWMAMAQSPKIDGPYKKDVPGRVFLGGHVAVFRGPDGGKWISYRNEVPDSPARVLLCIDPLRYNRVEKHFVVTPTLGPQAVPLPPGVAP